MNGSIYPPNPDEKVPPASVSGAFRSSLVGMEEEMPRGVVLEHLANVDAIAVITSAQEGPVLDFEGKRLNRDLNPVERKFRETIAWCSKQALWTFDVGVGIEVLNTIEDLQSHVANGATVFSGHEHPYSYYNHPE